jgi:hypothetical protein
MELSAKNTKTACKQKNQRLKPRKQERKEVPHLTCFGANVFLEAFAHLMI